LPVDIEYKNKLSTQAFDEFVNIRQRVVEKEKAVA
jgi:hypothetical protein